MILALRKVLSDLRADTFFKVLLAALLVLSVFAPSGIASYPSLVDWSTIAALAGLLLLTKGLEVSGGLHRFGVWLVNLMSTERVAAIYLVLAAALLSTVLTNDVALFVVVPLTLSVCRLTGMSATRFIVFEALAVNVGSTLTPIGNPQNLFIWQLAKVSFGEFVLHQLPLVVSLLVALIGLTALSFGGRRIDVRESDSSKLDVTLLALSLLLYVPFLLVTDMHQAAYAFAAVLLLYLVLRPRVVAQLDWGLLLVFVLMFIDLRLVARLGVVQELMQGLELRNPTNLYLAGIGASQLVSNVPAAIALAEYSQDWKVLAYGVNVGGFGLLIGSLANLIALRLSGDGKAWKMFHVYAVPALLVAALLGYLLLFGI